jgi:hypothetical protein
LTEFFKYFLRVLHEASSSWLKFLNNFQNHPVCSFNITTVLKQTEYFFKFQLWYQKKNAMIIKFLFIHNYVHTACSKNGVLTVHYGIEETTVNVRKMFKKFYWTYLLIWRPLKVALTR